MFTALDVELCWWGFCGAFIYAAPRLSAALFAAPQTGRNRGLSCLECAFSLIIGAMAALAFAPWVEGFLKMNGASELRAIAAVLGLLANPLAPSVIDGLGAKLIKRIKGESA